ncbi:MAG: hypothetical protein H8D63_00065 [Parcubacteria group bacterium]|nr:hypothetical protein [Parcubacteria group bacterium]
MNNLHEMPNKEVEVMVPEKAVRKVYQIYTEYLTQPATADTAVQNALRRIEDKEHIVVDTAGVCIAALERVAKDNGCILPEGTVRESYKERVIENVIEEMCAEPYYSDEQEKIVEYISKPRKLLLSHEPFRMMFSDDINDIAEDVLEDKRLALQREQFDVWGAVAQYEREEDSE